MLEFFGGVVCGGFIAGVAMSLLAAGNYKRGYNDAVVDAMKNRKA